MPRCVAYEGFDLSKERMDLLVAIGIDFDVDERFVAKDRWVDLSSICLAAIAGLGGTYVTSC